MERTLLLQATNISFTYTEQPLFQNLDLTIQSGQLWHVKGSNGHGKTTLLRILAGLCWPDSGEVLWHNKPLRQCREQYHRQLCYLGHHSGLKQGLTAREYVNFSRILADRHTAFTDQQLLHTVGLANLEHVLCEQLSAGQQRRLAMVSLLYEPPAQLWILDEPLAALDKAGIAWFNKLLMQHLARQGSIILTSHQTLESTLMNMHYFDL